MRRFLLIILVVLVLLELATLLVAYNPLAIFSRSAKWAFSTGGVINSSPAMVNGVVYVGSDDGTLYAIDAASGTKKWAYQTGSHITSWPTVVNGVVYVGSEDHNLYAFGLSQT